MELWDWEWLHRVHNNVMNSLEVTRRPKVDDVELAMVESRADGVVLEDKLLRTMRRLGEVRVGVASSPGTRNTHR